MVDAAALQALEHVLGTGVTVAELSTALSQRFQADPPIQVRSSSFEAAVEWRWRMC
jgi:hypothetical protein